MIESEEVLAVVKVKVAKKEMRNLVELDTRLKQIPKSSRPHINYDLLISHLKKIS